MKALLISALAFGISQVHGQSPGPTSSGVPRVIASGADPMGGLAHGAGAQAGGIRSVTYPTPTQQPATEARNFFIGGGIALGSRGEPGPGMRGLWVAQPESQAAGNRVAEAASDRHLQALIASRDQLREQDARLALLIREKRQARQPWVFEARRKAKVQNALQEFERQIARRKAALSK